MFMTKSVVQVYLIKTEYHVAVIIRQMIIRYYYRKVIDYIAANV